MPLPAPSQAQQLGKSVGADMGWALVLETGRLLTVQALAAAGVVAPSGCIVPQPDPAERESIAGADPRVTTVACTSHELIAALAGVTNLPAESTSITTGDVVAAAAAQQLQAAGFTGFRFVWLDYCGTFESRAGRRRQADIRRLIDAGLLAPQCVFAVTVSARGASPWYTGELVDSIVFSVRSAAAQAVPSVAVGTPTVVKYRVPGPHPPMRTVCIGLGPVEANPMHIEAPPNIQLFDSWACSDGSANAPRLDPCPALRAQQHIADVFAEIASQSEFGLHSVSLEANTAVLVLESRLLPVASAIRQKAPLAGITAVLKSEDDAAIAAGILRKEDQEIPVTTGPISITHHCKRGLCQLLRDTASASKSIVQSGHTAVRACWLGYERGKPRPASELVQCAGWSDLNELLATGAITAPAVLGIMINVDRTKLCWEGAEIDWLVTGVRAATAAAGFTALPLYTVRWTVGSAQVAVIFRIRHDDVNTTLPPMPVAAKAPPPVRVANWEANWGWDTDRLKIPTSGAKKYERVVMQVLAVVAAAGASAAVIHENGFFHVLPALLRECPALASVIAITCGDESQLKELHEKYTCDDRVSAQLEPSQEVIDAATALVLLTEGGIGAFRRAWNELLQGWKQLNRRCLCVLVDGASEEECMALAQNVLPGATQCDCYPVWCDSRQSVLVTVSCI